MPGGNAVFLELDFPAGTTTYYADHVTAPDATGKIQDRLPNPQTDGLAALTRADRTGAPRLVDPAKTSHKQPLSQDQLEQIAVQTLVDRIAKQDFAKAWRKLTGESFYWWTARYVQPVLALDAAGVPHLLDIRVRSKFELSLLQASLKRVSTAGGEAMYVMPAGMVNLLGDEVLTRSTLLSLPTRALANGKLKKISVDLVLAFAETGPDGTRVRGFTVEGLGFGREAKFWKKLYGSVKDADAAALLGQGYATVYVAWGDNGKSTAVHDFYATEGPATGEIAVIGVRAPLLTEAQYQTLLALLAANPGVGLQELLLNLHKNRFQSRLQGFALTREEVALLQSSFGISVDSLGNGLIASIMSTWWANYEFSVLPTLPLDRPNLFYQALNYKS